MAPESCNLDRDEAEVLKPSSSTSPPPPPPPPSSTASPPPSLFLKSTQELPSQTPGSGRPESVATADTACADSCNTKAEREDSSPVATAGEEKAAPKPAVPYINRCSSCQKRVGLMGFRCRCGELFCGGHRYSDTHDCSFDYKAAGRAEIARANPVVRASKIIKI